jgi:hypothetical protein
MKWEYWVQVLILPYGRQQALLTALNEVGEKGWKLVSVTQDKDDAYTLFWKRKKPY